MLFDAYKSDIQLDKAVYSRHGILIKQHNSIHWLTCNGSRILKRFTCECSPICAVFHDDNDGVLIVILVSPKLIRIFTSSGQISEVVLDFVANAIHSSPMGLIIQRDESFTAYLFSQELQWRYFSLSHCDAPIRPIVKTDDLESANDSSTIPLKQMKEDEEIMTTWGSYISFFVHKTQSISIYCLSKIPSTEFNESYGSASDFQPSVQGINSDTEHSGLRMEESTVSNPSDVNISKQQQGSPGGSLNYSYSSTGSRSRSRGFGVKRPRSSRQQSKHSAGKGDTLAALKGLAGAGRESSSASLMGSRSNPSPVTSEVTPELTLLHVANLPVLSGPTSLGQDDLHISFSISHGATLAHVLCRPTYELYTYSLPSLEKSQVSTPVLLRRLDGIVSVSHCSLGTGAVSVPERFLSEYHPHSSAELQATLLFNTDGVCDFVVGCGPTFARWDITRSLSHVDVCASITNISVVEKLTPHPATYQSQPIPLHIIASSPDMHGCYVMSLPQWSYLARRALIRPSSRSACWKLMEVLFLCLRQNDSDQNTRMPMEGYAAETISFILSLEFLLDRDAFLISALPCVVMATLQVSTAKETHEQVWQRISFILSCASPGLNDAALGEYWCKYASALQALESQSNEHFIAKRVFGKTIFHAAHMAMEDIHLQGVGSDSFTGKSEIVATTLALYTTSYVCAKGDWTGHLAYYRRVLILLGVSVREIDILVEGCMESVQEGFSEDVVSVTAWLAKQLELSCQPDVPLSWSPFTQTSIDIRNSLIGKPLLEKPQELGLHDSIISFGQDENFASTVRIRAAVAPLYIHCLLAPCITVTRNFLVNLALCLRDMPDERSRAIALAFISCCSNYECDAISGEEVINSLCIALRMGVQQALLAERDDLHFLYDQKFQCSIHCGGCVLSKWNWPLCAHDSKRGRCCCESEVDESCICKVLINGNSNLSSKFPRDILEMLGREDFIANASPSKLSGRYTVSSRVDDESRKHKDGVLVLLNETMRGWCKHVAEDLEVEEANEDRSGYDDNQGKEQDASSVAKSYSSSAGQTVDLDGLIAVNSLSSSRFAEDERMGEVCRLLRASKTLYLKVERTPEMTDSIFRYRQQLRLLSLCRRSLAFSVGRGMLTLSSLEPLLAEALPIPPLSLTGRVPPTNATITLDPGSVSPELTLWPEFHNGVAAGLRVRGAIFGRGSTTSRRRGKVTRNWILYNRINSANSSDGSTLNTASENAHAGSLLALGLLGHLKVLTAADICEYLLKGHDPTTIAMLIGLPASRIGSADPLLSKTLCLHLPAIMYPTHMLAHGELDVSPLVQTAALTGLGLLYCESEHRLMIELIMGELISSRRFHGSQVGGSEGDIPQQDTRECTALSAGWALGMLLLGRGAVKCTDKSSSGHHISDLHIEDRLQQCIDGGRRTESKGMFSSDEGGFLYGSDPIAKSSRILEGSFLNTNITAPGAIVALALMYIRSNNEEVASHIEVPPTVFALDNIRPDMLIYRSMGCCLILWDKVEPTVEWLRQKIPRIITSALFEDITTGLPGTHRASNIESDTSGGDMEPSFNPSSGRMNLRTSFQTMLCLLAGNCWGMALRYAGTADPSAKDVLIQQLKFLHCLRDGTTPTVDTLSFLFEDSRLAQFTELVSSCSKTEAQQHHRTVCRKLMTAAAEKASKPTLEMCITLTALSAGMVCAGSGDLDTLRVLRVLRHKVDEVTFGTHMGLAMSIGFLFLGQGKVSLKRDNISIAALVMSTIPRYPGRTMDNKSHLQALRHLYVIATEKRCLRAVDVDTGESTPIDVEVTLRSGNSIVLRIPTLLPELSSIVSIRSLSSNHFHASLDFENISTQRGFVSKDLGSCCSCKTSFVQPTSDHSPTGSLGENDKTDDSGSHTILYIKKRTPCSLQLQLNNKFNRRENPVSYEEKWASVGKYAEGEPAGSRYICSSLRHLNSQLAVDPSTSRIDYLSQVFDVAASTALSASCPLGRKLTTESMELHYTLTLAGVWTLGAATERFLLQVWDRHMSDTRSLTTRRTLEGLEIMSCKYAADSSLCRSCDIPLSKSATDSLMRSFIEYINNGRCGAADAHIEPLLAAMAVGSGIPATCHISFEQAAEAILKRPSISASCESHAIFVCLDIASHVNPL